MSKTEEDVTAAETDETTSAQATSGEKAEAESEEPKAESESESEEPKAETESESEAPKAESEPEAPKAESEEPKAESEPETAESESEEPKSESEAEEPKSEPEEPKGEVGGAVDPKLTPADEVEELTTAEIASLPRAEQPLLEADELGQAAEGGGKPAPGKQLYDFLSSYGFAVVLILFLFLLTFLGTIEQVEHGLFQVQKKYFESLFLVHQLELGSLKLPVPLPGVYLLLLLLTVNLVLGGIVRIKKHRRNVGVIVIHLGMLLLMAAGFVKLKFSDDGHLTLSEGQQSASYVSYHEWEVAIWKLGGQGPVKELLIPDAEITRLTEGRTTTFKHPELPFELKLGHYTRNARVLQKGPMWQSEAPVVNGFAIQAREPETENELNVAALYAEATTGQGAPQKGLLFGWRDAGPWVVGAGADRYAVDLRRRNFSLPFTVRLDKFTHELHPRTQIAKVYKSDVTKLESGTQEKVEIQMNEPLRHRGFVLFQARWGREPDGTLFSVFAVVRNPSDYWPLYACIVISIGLVMAFGQKLVGYVRSQAPKRQAA